MGTSGHPGDVESSATIGDFVDDLVCVFKHAKVVGKLVCIGFVPLFLRVGSPMTPMHWAVLDTTGVALSAGRLDAPVPTSSRVLSLSLFP